MSDAPVALLGGAPVSDPVFDLVLGTVRALSGPVVAADGGAVHALNRGIHPDAVFGDMDSLPRDVSDRIPAARLHRIAEQDTTDFDKALRHVAAPLVIGAGFLGGRLDHTLAALNVLVRQPARRCLLVSDDDVAFLCPPDVAFAVPPGVRLSLFPMAPVTGRSEGLRWPITGIDFAPGVRAGTSNRVTGPVRLRMDAPAMLVLMPPETLSVAVAALLAAPARWPAA